jgi:two-component system response regulator
MYDKNRIILLVEDNPDDEKLTLRALKKNNFLHDIVVVRDGAEALDYLFGEGKYEGRDTYEPPQVILLDINLPKIVGLEVLRCIRENEKTRLYPVVILSSSWDEKDLIESYKLGANSYICKSVDFDKFSESIHQFGLYGLVLNEAP